MMISLTHAMVLAAGLGTRMRPLTLERPKPLIEVCGRTLLDHALDRIQEAGIGNAVVNTHYMGEMIASHLAGRTTPRIDLSPEPELLETGGGVARALPKLGGGPFLVANADNLWFDGPRPAVERMVRAFDPEAMDTLLLLVPTVASYGYDGPGDYTMDQVGRLTRRAPGRVAPFVFSGVMIAAPAAYADVPAGAFSNNLLFDRAQERGRLFGIRHDGLWFHVGTPDAIAEVERVMDYKPPA
ncbi:nucleotidyltransferase family protein [Arenibaculum pallidiluteum]|uniref:nucleotidyltransferase family protein n=1 Tax=Arenibaculum pallidiluteum TaxID=2812559 RepID=UPI001A9655FD|nr:nucleotidyltransferase family protein [Arenibaculum pallidiluteum]